MPDVTKADRQRDEAALNAHIEQRMPFVEAASKRLQLVMGMRSIDSVTTEKGPKPWAMPPRPPGFEDADSAGESSSNSSDDSPELSRTEVEQLIYRPKHKEDEELYTGGTDVESVHLGLTSGDESESPDEPRSKRRDLANADEMDVGDRQLCQEPVDKPVDIHKAGDLTKSRKISKDQARPSIMDASTSKGDATSVAASHAPHSPLDHQVNRDDPVLQKRKNAPSTGPAVVRKQQKLPKIVIDSADSTAAAVPGDGGGNDDRLPQGADVGVTSSRPLQPLSTRKPHTELDTSAPVQASLGKSSVGAGPVATGTGPPPQVMGPPAIPKRVDELKATITDQLPVQGKEKKKGKAAQRATGQNLQITTNQPALAAPTQPTSPALPKRVFLQRRTQDLMSPCTNHLPSGDPSVTRDQIKMLNTAQRQCPDCVFGPKGTAPPAVTSRDVKFCLSHQAPPTGTQDLQKLRETIQARLQCEECRRRSTMASQMASLPRDGSSFGPLLPSSRAVTSNRQLTTASGGAHDPGQLLTMLNIRNDPDWLKPTLSSILREWLDDPATPRRGAEVVAIEFHIVTPASATQAMTDKTFAQYEVGQRGTISLRVFSIDMSERVASRKKKQKPTPEGQEKEAPEIHRQWLALEIVQKMPKTPGMTKPPLKFARKTPTPAPHLTCAMSPLPLLPQPRPDTITVAFPTAA
ncbi:hypothetical protein LTR66_011637, partial [Elasticomyces elasticus]